MNMVVSTADVCYLILDYLQFNGWQKSFEIFYQECPHFRNETQQQDLFDRRNLQDIVQGFADILIQGNTARQPQSNAVVLDSLWKKFDDIVSQIKHTSRKSFIKSVEHPTSSQRVRTRQGLNKRRIVPLKISTAMNDSPNSDSGGSTAIPLAKRTLYSSDSTSPIKTLVNVASDMYNEAYQHSEETSELIRSGYGSPKRKKFMPRKRHTIERIPDRNEQVVADSEMPQHIIETLLENTELQQRLASNINKVVYSSKDDPAIISEAPLEKDNVTTDIAGTSENNNDIISSLPSNASVENEVKDYNLSSDAVSNIVELTESDPAFDQLLAILDTVQVTLTPDVKSTNESCQTVSLQGEDHLQTEGASNDDMLTSIKRKLSDNHVRKLYFDVNNKTSPHDKMEHLNRNENNNINDEENMTAMEEQTATNELHVIGDKFSESDDLSEHHEEKESPPVRSDQNVTADGSNMKIFPTGLDVENFLSKLQYTE
ncbi:Protein NPAT [Trichoplax sp. H2]|nr:Protein NPAT [Trichoplax sp. H2]|eukprot:RDD46731.1 Protein NPAT [Trichoplax sp. H2]